MWPQHLSQAGRLAFHCSGSLVYRYFWPIWADCQGEISGGGVLLRGIYLGKQGEANPSVGDIPGCMNLAVHYPNHPANPSGPSSGTKRQGPRALIDMPRRFSALSAIPVAGGCLRAGPCGRRPSVGAATTAGWPGPPRPPEWRRRGRAPGSPAPGRPAPPPHCGQQSQLHPVSLAGDRVQQHAIPDRPAFPVV